MGGGAEPKSRPSRLAFHHRQCPHETETFVSKDSCLTEYYAPDAKSRWHAYLEAYRIMPDDALLEAQWVELTNRLTALSVTPEFEALLALLSNPTTMTSLQRLLQHAELLAYLVEAIDGVIRRSETIIESSAKSRNFTNPMPGVEAAGGPGIAMAAPESP